MEGEELGAHLAHADVVAEGAVDDRGVVVDIQDVHPQNVLLPPRGNAAIRRLDLQSGVDFRGKKCCFEAHSSKQNSLGAQTMG